MSDQEHGERQQYANKCELMLSLVGYAVGLGNIWRFPYLAYQYGGASFLIPYFVALVTVGLPLFILELGLGQMYRAGTVGIWEKLGLRPLRGAGLAATICTWLVSLYYNIILTWTVYFIGRTIAAIPSGILPWTDQIGGDFACPETTYYIHKDDIDNPYLFGDGMLNKSSVSPSTFWCANQEENKTLPTETYMSKMHAPRHCPSAAAIQFWEQQVLRQSSGMDEIGGIDPGLLVSYTMTWLMVYLIIFKGVEGSGKVVYVTALLPYVVLVSFFVRAITLPNAGVGVSFFVTPDFSLLMNGEVWQRAVIQIFYSLGVGFGSLIAFASYGAQDDNFVGNAVTVSFVNCATSVFAGFVVFPILGYLAMEISQVNPCVRPEQVGDLSVIGLQGTSLAFIAFPIAISKMPFPFFWAFLFFALLLCLGIDSQFAMVESVMTVLKDSGLAGDMSHPLLAAIVCGVGYVIGLIFITDGGIYWFNLFDYYTCVVALFFVTGLECYGLMWADSSVYPTFKKLVKTHTGVALPGILGLVWKVVCPVVLLAIVAVTVWDNPDLMGAETSVRFPEGTGYLPGWSVHLGWVLSLAPIGGFLVVMVFCNSHASSYERVTDSESDEEDEDDDEESEEPE